MIPQTDVAQLFAWAQANDLALFPIRAWSKQPTGIVGSHASDWSKEVRRWEAWYRDTGGCNFGVSCGPSRVIVVDVDRGGFDGFRAWCTANLGFEINSPTVISPTSGWHVYFKVPAGTDSETLRQPNLSGKEVNVRAGHGYVVAPWSVTDPIADSSVKIKGAYRSYDVLRLAPPPLVAHCLPDRREEPLIRPVEDVELGEDGLPLDALVKNETSRRAVACLSRLLQAVPGERNEKMNQAAFDLGKLVAEGKLAEWRAVDMLIENGEAIGIARDEAKARSTIRSGLKAGASIGRPEPRSAMLALLASAVPIEAVRPRPIVLTPKSDSLVPAEPFVERLIHRGQVTVLSGASGTGKTTFLASLVAASVADAKDFEFGEFGAASSDLLLQPCAWIFLSYEGGQNIQRTTAAWHVGSACAEKYPDRFKLLTVTGGPLVASKGRDVVVNEAQAKLITDAIDEMRRLHPGMPLVLAIDNASSAVENCMDQVHAQRFCGIVRALADQDIAVVVLAHPPKSGHSDIIGAHLFFSLSDIVGVIEVLKHDNGEWVQWIDFSKHRPASNGQCLEVRSRRLSKPLVELPEDWGFGNTRARARQMREMHIPYVSSIRVRHGYERESVEKGVTIINEVTPKTEANVRL